MSKRWINVAVAVFFCTSGWVYVGWAMGAEGVSSGKSAGGGIFDKAAPDGAPAEALDKAVKVGPLGQIDLHVKDQEISKILQLLSIQAQRNIVASKGVTGTISADLYNVDFYEALSAILNPNGYGYREKGNFIYVYTAAELKALQDAERKVAARVIRLNYITADDANKFLAPLLSSAGSITLAGQVTPGFQPTISDGGANSFAHTDTLVVRDYPDNLQQIMDVVKQLDVRPKQVLVEATVLQCDLTENNAFGVDINVLLDYNFAQFTGSPLTAVDNIINGSIVSPVGAPNPTVYGNLGRGEGLQSGVGNTNATGGSKFGIISRNISAFIRALDSVTDTTVVARPKLLVLNRQKADLLIGGKLGYVSTTATQTSQTQTVDFLEIGTKLTLRPFISEDGFIRMELKPSINDGTTTNVTSGNTVVIVPNTTTQELTTNVVVRTGQTIVLGGLFKENTTIARRQVPFMGDVPILGTAFKGQDDTIKRSEIIFLVTPTIVKDEALYAAGERANESVDLARLGARESLLPWSRSKLVSSHLEDAVKDFEQGHKDKALWSVNMALALDPTLVEARRMKERITAERVQTLPDSIFKNVIDEMLRKQLELDKTPDTAPRTDAGVAAPKTAAAQPAKSLEPASPPKVEAAPVPAAAPVLAPAAQAAPTTQPAAVSQTEAGTGAQTAPPQAAVPTTPSQAQSVDATTKAETPILATP